MALIQMISYFGALILIVKLSVVVGQGDTIARPPTTGYQIYDNRNQICCSGTVYTLNSTTISSTSCCGKNSYDTNVQTCCDNKVYKIQTTGNYQCCGSSYVNFKPNEICCIGKIQTVPGNATDYQCCGVNPFLSGNSLQCCGNTTFNSSSQICCYTSGIALDLPTNCPNQGLFLCCGKQLMNSDQQCLNGQIYNPSTVETVYPSSNYPTNFTAYSCGTGGIFQDPASEICCGDSLLSNLGFADSCCNGLLYNSTAQRCCGDKLYSMFDYSLSCCGDTFYNTDTQLCCAQQVVKKPNQYSNCCS